MSSAYSSFFSSGLLAPPVTIYSSEDYHVNLDDDDMLSDSFLKPGSGGGGGPLLSPAAPSSPMAVPDDSDLEDEPDMVDSAYGRATTPTPESRLSLTTNVTSWGGTTNNDGLMLSNPPPPNKAGLATALAGSVNQMPSPMGGAANSNYNSNQVQLVPRSPSQPPNGGRRLRRRKSSLAGAQSPMSAIKSPSRSAGHALELQRHLLAAPSRSRSGSVSFSAAAAAAADVMTNGQHPAAGNEPVLEQNTFMQRLRSGSVSCFGSFRRKPLRRVSMQPAAPPPTAPLPALPPSLADTPNCGFLEPAFRSAPPNVTRMPLAHRPVLSQNLGGEETVAPNMYRKNRDRSYSVNAYDRIDEDMKEN